MSDDPEAGSRGPEAGHHEAVQAEAAAQGGGGGGGARDHDRHRVCGISTFTRDSVIDTYSSGGHITLHSFHPLLYRVSHITGPTLFLLFSRVLEHIQRNFS